MTVRQPTDAGGACCTCCCYKPKYSDCSTIKSSTQQKKQLQANLQQTTATTIRTPSPPLPPPLHVPSLSFSGCGLHAFFHLGVAHCLLANNVQCQRVCATSAGIVAALYYLLDLRKYFCIEEILDRIPFCYSSSHSASPHGCGGNGGWFGGGYRMRRNGMGVARRRMMKRVADVLREHVPDAYKRVSGRLEIVLTRFPGCKLIRACNWHSNDDLIECLYAATAIPMVGSGLGPVRWRCSTYYDGGMLCSHPIVDADTVCVSTSAFTQPWTRAWRLKSDWYGEISHPVTFGSLNIMERCFYAELWNIGCQRAGEYVCRVLGRESIGSTQCPCDTCIDKNCGAKPAPIAASACETCTECCHGSDSSNNANW